MTLPASARTRSRADGFHRHTRAHRSKRDAASQSMPAISRGERGRHEPAGCSREAPTSRGGRDRDVIALLFSSFRGLRLDHAQRASAPRRHAMKTAPELLRLVFAACPMAPPPVVAPRQDRAPPQPLALVHVGVVGVIGRAEENAEVATILAPPLVITLVIAFGELVTSSAIPIAFGEFGTVSAIASAADRRPSSAASPERAAPTAATDGGTRPLPPPPPSPPPPPPELAPPPPPLLARDTS
jgi:hypothetical protein